MRHTAKNCAAAAFVLFAAAARAADTTAPQLINLSISPASVDTSSGPAVVSIAITAQDDNSGFSGSAGGNAIVLTHEFGSNAFGRQNLPVTGGTATNPVFQFTLTIPQFSLPGAYRVSITLVDDAFNTATFSAAHLQSLGLPSTVTVTQNASGSVALNPSTANVSAAGGPGSLLVTASSPGFSWSAASNAVWLTITSGASGTGNGTIGYTAAPNNTGSQRTAVVTVSGRAFTALQAAAGSNLNVTTNSLAFTYRSGGAAPASRQITAYSSGAPLTFTAAASSVGNWLFVSPASGVTSTILSVWVDPVSLAPGTYTGVVTVTAAGSSNGSISQTVTLNVSAASTVAVAPGALSFFYQQGGSNPLSQLLSVTGGSAVSFTATASSAGGWLSASPASATTPSNVLVSVSPSGLGPGTYAGSIAFAGQTVPVTLAVTPGPTFSSSPSSFSFTYAVGGAAPAVQSLILNGTLSDASFSASASSAGNWLSLAATVPGVMGVSVNPFGLPVGVYSGAITLAASSITPHVVPVTLIVTVASIATAPSILNFRYRQGGALPGSQTTSVSAGGPALSFTVFASSQGDWLVASPSSGVTPATLSVAAFPRDLAPGTYPGAITITAAGTPPGGLTVLASLTVEGAGTLVVGLSTLEINYQTGDANPVVPTLSVSSSGAAMSFTAISSSAGNWLAVSPASGSTPATLTVQVNPATLGPGSYAGTIQIASPSLTSQSVAVTLNVRAPQDLILSAPSLAFTYQAGGPAPVPQTLTLGCSGSALTFRASAASLGVWLSSSVPNTPVNDKLIVSVNPAGLNAGSYSGEVTIFGGGACNKSQTLPVTLVVMGAAAQSLILTVSSLSFSYQVGAGAPSSQALSIGCGSGTAPFTAFATSGPGWLRVSPTSGSTPATLIVSVDASALAPGLYSGSVTVAVAGACAGNQSVSVSLVVAAGAPQQLVTSALSFGAGSLSFAATAGGAAPSSQTVSLSCGGAAGPFSTSVTSAGGWLSVNPLNGTTTGTLTVSVNPTGLLPGSYSGSISATSTACGPATPLPVTFTVGQSAPAGIPKGLTIAPLLLTFNYQTGAVNPPGQTLTITGLLPFTATASSAGGWLAVVPPGATAPAPVTVAVNPAGLLAGTYTGAVTIATGNSEGGATYIVAVTLSVTTGGAPPPVTSPLSFTYQQGGALPPSQSLAVGAGLTGLASIVATSSPGNWLGVSPTSAVMPANVTVSVNPAGLATGSYSGVLMITLAGGLAGSQIAATLQVTAAPAGVAPRISSLLNAASLLSSPLAPGEIISIFGTGLGPVDAESLRLTPANLVDNSLAATRVIINGKPAPVLFTQAAQVNTIIPFSAAGQSTVQLQVEFQGVRTSVANFSIAEAAPAIFSIDGSGRGQAALLNEDTSINSNLNPADRGSIAVLYATGAGQMAPAMEDGAITGTTLPRPVLAVSVLIDGQNATVEYAGAAPGLVAGVLQVNFRIPPQVRAGTAVGILLKVGRFTSQAGLTMAIR